MTQRQLNRAAARATGESTATIARMGFSPCDDDPSAREPLTTDWDVLDAARPGLFPQRSRKRRAIA